MKNLKKTLVRLRHRLPSDALILTRLISSVERVRKIQIPRKRSPSPTPVRPMSHKPLLPIPTNRFRILSVLFPLTIASISPTSFPPRARHRVLLHPTGPPRLSRLELPRPIEDPLQMEGQLLLSSSLAPILPLKHPPVPVTLTVPLKGPPPRTM